MFGNLKHTLEVGGADLSKIELVIGHERHGGGGGKGDAVEAVARGEVAAANVDAPFDRRGEKLGLHRLETPSIPVIHNCTICANGEWVKDNQDTTNAFLRSMIDAIHYFKTQKQKSCAIIERGAGPADRPPGR